MSNRKEKLQKLLNNLSNIDTGVQDVFKSVDQELQDIGNKLKKSVELKTVAEANDQFKKLQELFKPILPAFEELKKSLDERDAKLITQLKERLNSITESFTEADKFTAKEIEAKGNEILQLRGQIKEISDRKIVFPDFTPQIKAVDNKLNDLSKKVPTKDEVDGILEEIKTWREELGRVERMARERGGGNANRQINVKSSVMSTRYTDINFVQGGGIGWTATDDTTNKRVNLTASILIGTGGGGAGTPGGANTQVQFNDNGAFGGSSTLTWNKNTSILSTTKFIATPTIDATDVLRINNGSSQANLQFGAYPLNNGYGTLWLGNITPDNTNYAFIGNGTTETIFNAPTGGKVQFRIGQANGPSGATLTTTGLGIFADVPVAPLDVEKAVNNIIANFGNGNFGNLSIDSQSSPNRYRIYTDNGSPNIELLTSGGSINLNPSGSGQVGINNGSPQARLDIGLTSSIAGTLRMQGSTAGYVQIQPASTAGSWTMTLPNSSGGSGQYLLTDGNGITQWASVTASGGSGITRSTSIITANTTGGSTGSTDYVYIATNSLNFTLPNPASNGNLYTIKNATNSSVVVTALAGKTMDGSGSVVSAVNNQALDFISDGTNYRIV